MSFDLWTQEFCLACDKQVHIDGAAYCSEACRLTDFEKTSPACSHAASPQVSSSWAPTTTPIRQVTRPKFYLSPAYDFSNAQPYGTTPVAPRHFDHFYASKSLRPSQPAPLRQLTPSSSHSSLCSMQSNSSSESVVSDKAKKELQAYAVSFEQVRTQRRRSY
ncbi:hypothetical protein VHEMI00201 [[Torrubiella] hemipterigena]|uniref:Life-span regulatory factor domain-containing protein n=1 Tax=[Torrubiella] hemipterigena TaxID=1531966 RepID=A0A0A1SIL5_9HYPO|nr:hypothetical protein VHEMI00201 [[Torrubiella] hemipterigena]